MRKAEGIAQKTGERQATVTRGRFDHFLRLCPHSFAGEGKSINRGLLRYHTDWFDCSKPIFSKHKFDAAVYHSSDFRRRVGH